MTRAESRLNPILRRLDQTGLMYCGRVDVNLNGFTCI